ncbi:MAG TPA: carboxypeptidase-like regulatory domain-containing protein [Bryobacteraceae bacterium]
MPVFAQDPTATLEGRVTHPSGAVISGAAVKATRLDTGASQTQQTSGAGAFSFPVLPAGIYGLRVEAARFTPFVQAPIALDINQTARLSIAPEVAGGAKTITVEGAATLVEMGANTLGNVVSGRELVDLPLNGRNFTQLGLLQPGVAPLTAGIATGRRLAAQRAGVCGQRPAARVERLPARRSAQPQPRG